MMAHKQHSFAYHFVRGAIFVALPFAVTFAISAGLNLALVNAFWLMVAITAFLLIGFGLSIIAEEWME